MTIPKLIIATTTASLSFAVLGQANELKPQVHRNPARGTALSRIWLSRSFTLGADGRARDDA
jgi:hypothetical protein